MAFAKAFRTITSDSKHVLLPRNWLYVSTTNNTG